MSSNSFGKLLTLTTFGESHGKAIGAIIDGFPAGFAIDFAKLNRDLARRRTNQNNASSTRNEKDEVEFLSGIFEGLTTGTPIGFLVWNTDQKSEHYEDLKSVFRPSHADFTYQQKYGIRDYRGGGRSSARETLNWVVAGSIANQYLENKGIKIVAHVSNIGGINISNIPSNLSQQDVDNFPYRFPDSTLAQKIEELLAEVKKDGDSLGGVVTCSISGCPVGLGNPIFEKLQANLAKAMLTINAAKGFEYGKGFDSANMKGSEFNDEIIVSDGLTSFKSNNSGGILGGISNGDKIFFKVAFKPVASISKPQKSIDLQGNHVDLEIHGRHDVVVVPRAVPIVEALAALVLLDELLIARAYGLKF